MEYTQIHFIVVVIKKVEQRGRYREERKKESVREV